MLAKRIISCLDIKDGRTVKGTNFYGLRDAGCAVELAERYSREGADELVFLDISATLEKRKTLVKLVCDVAANINIPFTVGGGINTVGDIEELLNAGADKISLNSGAVRNPELITEAAKNFGSQAIVLAIDAKRSGDRWMVFTHGGRKAAGKESLEWARNVTDLGAGEILLTSIDADGTKRGFDVELTKAVSASVGVPVIASGGAGKMDDFTRVFSSGRADAALAASIFHFREIEIPSLKKYLSNSGVTVRI